MFVVLLKFSENKDKKDELMDAHKVWVKQGFDDGVILIAGSLQPNLGGAIFAQAASRDDLVKRVNDDPFVRENVVSVEIHVISVAMADERLDFLKG